MAKATRKPTLLSGGNPQIPMGEGAAPVKAYIAALPGWKKGVGRKIDAVVTKAIPGVRKAVKWNSPFYGAASQGWVISVHAFTNFMRVTFFNGAALMPLPPKSSKQKDVRYYDVYEDAGVDEKQLAAWAKQAASVPGWKAGW
jgi:hypothetical protein